MGITTHIEQRFQRLAIFFVIYILAFVNVMIFVPMHSSAVPTMNMYLFWDPANGSVPTDWVQVTSIGGTSITGLFIRGEAPGATFNGRGGHNASAITPTFTTSVGTASGGTLGNGNTANAAVSTHTHVGPTVTNSPIDTAPGGGDTTNVEFPAFRSLQLIRYSPSGADPGGIPTTIPQNAIAMFDSTTLPTGFLAYTGSGSPNQDGRMIMINSTTITGGNDTLNNSVALSTLPNGVGTDQTTTLLGGTNSTAAGPTHTHSITTPVSVSTSTLPPYVQPVLGYATTAVNTISINLISMFDSDPGSGWVVLSNTGGTFYQKFIRPLSTAYSTGGGNPSRIPTASFTTGPASTSVNTYNLVGGTLSPSTHTHTVTVTGSSTSNLPQYFNVVVAQKVSFVLNAYRWYVESGSEQVTDPWPSGTLNIAQDTQLPAVPAAYKPPRNNAIFGTPEQIRLRIQIVVYGKPLVANSTSFKLQYQQTKLNDCLAGTWTDVDPNGSGTAAWRYGSNGVTDPTQLTITGAPPNQITPASSVLEVFSRSATTAGTPNAAPTTGQTIEYDWLIQNYSANDGTEYRFRVIETSGTPLSLYEKVSGGTLGTNECPSLVTRPGTAQQLRHGAFFQDNVEKGYTWVE